MKLRHASIAGYRSISGPLELDLDDRVTVILGANDHGKTNLLNALLHLNPDAPFGQEDLSWDHNERPDEFPAISFVLTLTADERREMRPVLEQRARLSDLAKLRTEYETQFRTAQKEASASDSSSVPLGDKAESSTVDEGLAAAELARLKLGVVYAEEFRSSRALTDSSMDLGAALAAADASARSASANAKRLRTKATSARAGVTSFVTPGKPTDAELRLVADAEAAERDADTAANESEHAAATQGLLQAAVDAEARFTDGKYSFWREPRLPAPKLRLEDIPLEVTLRRRGLRGDLEVDPSQSLSVTATDLLDGIRAQIPRVELLRAIERVPDSVTRTSLREPDNDFMRGIFGYAALLPPEWDRLFDQTDVSTRRLAKAERQLNETLRNSWSQGRELTFKLDHNGDEIDLLIEDPAVASRFVRASKRSSGFTHFFSLKTMLHAREQATEASSFIWLFDEPGIYLHPEGQHDLLQVIETLSAANQIAYVTHSIFLTNKNYPTRHRLLIKTQDGTRVDQKPFLGQWRAAIDALGLGLPGTFLFASRVLLTEGDSDPIYLYADIQKLIEMGELTFDINGFSIMSTGDSRNADPLIRILLASALAPKVALLFDGDRGGLDRLKYLKELVEQKGLPTHPLTKGSTIEDHLVAPDLYVRAAARYCTAVFPTKDISGQLIAAYEERASEDGLAHWTREQMKNLLQLEEAPSSVGIAREYTQLLTEAQLDEKKATRRRASTLAKKIADMLSLPAQTRPQDRITEA